MQTSSVTLGSTSVSSSDHAKNLGVTFQSDLSLDSQISAVSKSSFYRMRDIKRIRSCLSLHAATAIGNSFVHSMLDYCNSLYYGLPQRALQRRQKVQNCLARVVSRAPHRAHTTPILKSLHWLPVRFRIDYPSCSLHWTALVPCIS